MHKAKMHKALLLEAVNEVWRSEDRISGLPDAVLGHILSYVTTKESVRTSILSKRWLLVWSYVPFLDLDDSSLSGTDLNKDQAIHSSFTQFITKLFYLYDVGSLKKLTLKCSKFDRYRVNEWVMAAMKLRVPKLDLCITNNGQHFTVGVPLFAYQDLVYLKLDNLLLLDIPGEVLLPRLKKLLLDSVQILNGESCRKLLGGCPVLECLFIKTCRLANIKTLEITAPKLKLLVLQHGHSPNNNDLQIVVDAPSLEVLKYVCFMAGAYSFKNLNSLDTADILVDLKHVDRSQVSKIRKAALELVNGIANAKSISLPSRSLELLSFLDPTALPMFNKCTELILGVTKNCGMLLPKFLENSPCLQKLVLDQNTAYDALFGEFIWHSPTQVPKCLLCSLEKVEIRGCDGQRDMLKLVDYLVSNSRVLVELSSGSTKKEEHKELKVCKQLLSSLLKVS